MNICPQPAPKPRVRPKAQREDLEEDWRQVGNDLRKVMGLPEQRRAYFIDSDGTKHHHDLDVTSEGKPHLKVKIREVGVDTDWREYRYAGERDGYLIYREDFDNQHECGDCGWIGGQANYCPMCGSSFVKHWSWWCSN